jgi:hypothetical protein
MKNNNYINKFGDYYALFHIPSGLYYVPNHYKTKSNLSSFPHLYSALPFDLREGNHSFFYDENQIRRMVFLKDWEIAVISVKPTNFLNYEQELKIKNEANRSSSNRISE